MKKFVFPGKNYNSFNKIYICHNEIDIDEEINEYNFFLLNKVPKCEIPA